jgi:hypothetical protein
MSQQTFMANNKNVSNMTYGFETLELQLPLLVSITRFSPIPFVVVSNARQMMDDI